MRLRLLLIGLAAVAAGCSKPAPPKTTIQQYMEGTVNPAGNFLFGSVEQISDAHGLRLKAPHTDAEWQEVRDELKILHDAPDVLTRPDIKVAPPGFKPEHPEVESDPAWIQRTIAAHRDSFASHAMRLRQAADTAERAVDLHDALALQRDLDGIDKACESCHLHFFYPKDKRAWEAAKEDGMPDKPGVF